MTSLTITLTPEVYAQLQREAERHGKAEQEIAQELLAQQLADSADQVVTTTYPELAPDVRSMLATMTDADMIVAPQQTPDRVGQLFAQWNAEDAEGNDEDGEESWDAVLRAIDTHRASPRKLFPQLHESS
jgi:hypothetical protein